jgi:hypothetical protein
MLQHGVTAIDTFPTIERHISGITVGISSTMYRIIETEIQAFKDRIINLVNRDDAGNQVFQLNLQFFLSARRSTRSGRSKRGRYETVNDHRDSRFKPFIDPAAILGQQVS